jgi:hypothetical protein
VYRRLAAGAEAHCGECRPVTTTRLTAENASGDKIFNASYLLE